MRTGICGPWVEVTECGCHWKSHHELLGRGWSLYVYMCLVLFIGHFEIAQSKGEKAVGKMYLLSWLPHGVITNTTHFLATHCLLKFRSSVKGILGVKMTSVKSMLTLKTHFCCKEDTSHFCYLCFVPCAQEAHHEGNRNQNVEKFQGNETYLALGRWNQYITRELNCFLDVLCVVFNLMHSIKMQDSSQKFASENKSGIHPNAWQELSLVLWLCIVATTPGPCQSGPESWVKSCSGNTFFL